MDVCSLWISQVNLGLKQSDLINQYGQTCLPHKVLLYI